MKIRIRKTHVCVFLAWVGMGCAQAAEPISGPVDEAGFRGYIQHQELQWQDLQRWPGIQAKLLSEDQDSGRLAVYAAFPKARWLDQLPVIPQSVDLVMLEGDLQVGEQVLGKFDFAFIPPSLKPPVMISHQGATALLFFDPPATDPAAVSQQQHAGVFVARYSEDRWVTAELAKSAGAEADLKLMHLKQDPFTSARSWYVKLEGGMTVPWEVHSMPEEGFVMQGGYRLAECLPQRTVLGEYSEGGYFWRPGGIPHSGPDSGPTGDGVMWLQRSPIALDVVFYQDCRSGQVSEPIKPAR